MILLLTPLKKELQLLLSALESLGFSHEKFQDQGFWFYKVSKLNMTCTIGGHGKEQFAKQSQYGIDYLKNIEHLYCVGSAGALHPQVNNLDLVCATKIVEHDNKDKTDKMPEYHCYLPSNKKGTFNFQVHQGLIASGNEDITSPQRAEELSQQTQALAVAWEGAGGARTAKANNIPYTEVRAITDNARTHVKESFNKNLKPAIKNLTTFLTTNLKL